MNRVIRSFAASHREWCGEKMYDAAMDEEKIAALKFEKIGELKPDAGNY
jgi:hypothetical protein